MAITWKQIDTNGNGYVDGDEAQTAKQKGVKNVWNNMTEADYKNNTGRAAKLSNIISQFPDNPTEVHIYTNIVIGYSEEEKQKMFKEKRERIEARLLELNRKSEQYKKQIEEYEQQLKAELDAVPSSTTDGLAVKYYEAKYWLKDTFSGPKPFGYDYIEQQKKYVKSNLNPERQERVAKREEIENRLIPLIRHIRETRQGVLTEMRCLVEELYSFTGSKQVG